MVSDALTTKLSVLKIQFLRILATFLKVLLELSCYFDQESKKKKKTGRGAPFCLPFSLAQGVG